ncbi:MAG: alcohol dehydrogenase catalytic domain-containing protein, partial [Acidimicrobiia bacterium]|nr:alcohol dehydrogenase catalytic domain-containing protein [Acidimicrobiia bacterium]
MRAAVFHGNHDIRIEDVPAPVAGRDDLLLEVLTVGVCGTDAAEYDTGPSMFPIARRDRQTGHEGPMIPGHEFVGRIEAVGAGVVGFEVGMEVVTT